MKKTSALTVALCVAATASFAANYLEPGCDNSKYTAAQISDAIAKSPTANQTLKNASCTFGGAGVAESGGDSCRSNGANFGVLQLASVNLRNYQPPMSSNEYLNLPLQDQVDIWAKMVGGPNTGAGYQALQSAKDSGQTIGGATPTSGMMAACFQFGPGICQKDVEFMRANGGACPTVGNGGRNINVVGGATANLDGNNQSICSWGAAIQTKINQSASSCKNTPDGPAQCELGPGGFTPGTPTAANATAPTDATITVPDSATAS